MKSNNSLLIGIIIILAGIIIGGLFALKNVTKVQSKETIEAAARSDYSSRPAAPQTNDRRDDNYGYRQENIRQSGGLDDLIDVVCNEKLDASDISHLSKADMRILRNAVYARHGYKFKSADLQDYFSRYSWYSPRKTVIPETELSATEQANIMLIKSYE